MEKKPEVPKQNFSEGKTLHYLCSVVQCVKLSFMNKNFEKWREVIVLNFSNLVLKRYWKSMENDFRNMWEPWITCHTKCNVGWKIRPRNPSDRGAILLWFSNSNRKYSFGNVFFADQHLRTRQRWKVSGNLFSLKRTVYRKHPVRYPD